MELSSPPQVWSGLYVLVQETTPRSHRSFTGYVGNGAWNLGSLAVCLLAYLLRDWRSIQLCLATSSLLLLLYLPLLPESPRWLLSKGRTTQAVHLLATMARRNGVLVEQDQLLASCTSLQQVNQDKEPGCFNGLVSLFSHAPMRRQLLLLAPVFFITGMTSYGIHFAIRFAHLDLFTVGSLKEAAAMLLMLLLLYLHPRVDRTSGLVTTYLLAGTITLLALLLPFSWRGGLLIISQALFIGLYFLLDVYVIEILPTEVRNFGFNLLESVSKTGSALAPFVVDLGGETVVLAVFGTLSLVAALPLVGLPETRGRALLQRVGEVGGREGGSSIVERLRRTK